VTVRSALLARDWQQSAVTPEQATALIRPGDQVFVSTGCATPVTMLRAIEDTAAAHPGIRLLHYITRAVDRTQTRSSRHEHRVWYVSRDIVPLEAERKVHYAPVSIGEMPSLITAGRFTIDVAVLQVSPPSASGSCSLGVSADLGKTMVEHARTLIAEINPAMPVTRGDTLVPLEAFDAWVEVEPTMLEYEPRLEASESSESIARYVARLVPDGATLQIGPGTICSLVLRYLQGREDLGVHSDLITDSVLDLMEAGVITGKQKSMSRGKVVTSLAMGTRRLYDALHEDKRFVFRPIDEVTSPRIVMSQHRMVSINQASCVDLTGQVCTEARGGRIYGGIGAGPVFHYAAARSPGGRAIICMPSREPDGAPAVRCLLRPEQAVTIPRYETRWVITEYGAAYLFGATLRQRAVALIEIAHPDDREGLLEQARDLGLLPPEQKMRSRRDYPVEEERELVIDGTQVRVRPTKTTDARLLQQLFYALSPQDVHTRFFRHLASLTTSAAEHLTSVSYDREMAIAVVTGDQEHEQIVATASYYVDPETGLADVAYMVHPDWQGKGLGSLLHKTLADYAVRHGVRGFTADVLAENAGMLRVFEKGPGSVSTSTSSGVMEVLIDLRTAGEHGTGPLPRVR
jgi:acyl-CoA hydrolase/RimJ/RimL family protein N-acetyltransferase